MKLLNKHSGFLLVVDEKYFVPFENGWAFTQDLGENAQFIMYYHSKDWEAITGRSATYDERTTS